MVLSYRCICKNREFTHIIALNLYQINYKHEHWFVILWLCIYNVDNFIFSMLTNYASNPFC